MVDLLAETAELMVIPSPSHHEQDLADHIERRLRAAPWLEVTRIGANVIARTTGTGPGRIVLAGHLDTVPANGNATPRTEGDTLWGLGAADMKSGLAVNLHLATTIEDPATEVTYVFYAAEEVAREHNGLLAVAAARPDLLAGDVAILGEPTNALIEAGCQGVVKLRVTLAGRRAHTARPWMGINAVHRLVPL
ncbi:MAG: M20/M25/M40 family metallo-hydrolase, partial [Actinomycetota bacterium]|nr:M20/M25/M40 family metallo-hydrolase [Actinomycetota bacterium]